MQALDEDTRQLSDFNQANKLKVLDDVNTLAALQKDEAIAKR